MRPSFTRYGDHDAEVLDAADLDVGVVDVDPGVGEAVLLGHDERDGHEVAVAQRSRPPRATSGGTGGSIASSSALIGIDEITSVHS